MMTAVGEGPTSGVLLWSICNQRDCSTGGRVRRWLPNVGDSALWSVHLVQVVSVEHASGGFHYDGFLWVNTETPHAKPQCCLFIWWCMNLRVTSNKIGTSFFLWKKNFIFSNQKTSWPFIKLQRASIWAKLWGIHEIYTLLHGEFRKRKSQSGGRSHGTCSLGKVFRQIFYKSLF